jgi:hypothetical protein
MDEVEAGIDKAPRTVEGKSGVPGWYWLVAVAALLFEAVGCYAYFLEVMRSPAEVASLPLDQRRLIELTPVWITGAYAVAVWVGLMGAVGLLLRRRFAVLALLVSLVAIVVQFGGILLVPALRSSIPSDQLLGPIIIFVIAYGLWQFATMSRKRGWLA